MLLMQLNLDWLETIYAERRDFFGAKMNTKYILYRLFFDAFNTLSAAACFSCVTKGHLPLCQRVNQTFRIFVFDALNKKCPRIFVHIPFYEALHCFLSVVCVQISPQSERNLFTSNLLLVIPPRITSIISPSAYTHIIWIFEFLRYIGSIKPVLKYSFKANIFAVCRVLFSARSSGNFFCRFFVCCVVPLDKRKVCSLSYREMVNALEALYSVQSET